MLPAIFLFTMVNYMQKFFILKFDNRILFSMSFAYYIDHCSVMTPPEYCFYTDHFLFSGFIKCSYILYRFELLQKEVY